MNASLPARPFSRPPSYLEGLLTSPDVEEVRRMRALLADTLVPRLQEAGFQSIVFEDAMELLLDLLAGLDPAAVAAGSVQRLTLELLLTQMRDPHISNHVIYILRLVMSAEMQARCVINLLHSFMHAKSNKRQNSPYLFDTRPLLSRLLQTRAQFFAPFVEGEAGLSVPAFCQ